MMCFSRLSNASKQENDKGHLTSDVSFAYPAIDLSSFLVTIKSISRKHFLPLGSTLRALYLFLDRFLKVWFRASETILAL
jgi:hypothetical protein